jgi:hypothetical protein
MAIRNHTNLPDSLIQDAIQFAVRDLHLYPFDVEVRDSEPGRFGASYSDENRRALWVILISPSGYPQMFGGVLLNDRAEALLLMIATCIRRSDGYSARDPDRFAAEDLNAWRNRPNAVPFIDPNAITPVSVEPEPHLDDLLKALEVKRHPRPSGSLNED